MRIRRLSVLVAIAAALLAATPADAAVRTRVDSGIRFTLDGKRLTVRIVDRPIVWRNPPLSSQLFDKRILVACGTSFRRGRTRGVLRRERWPRGARSRTFVFKRDISRAVRWCVLEPVHQGGDVAAVSFLQAEPRRLVAKGRAPSGAWWRLYGGRGDRHDPCVGLLLFDDHFSQCLNDEAEIEARLATVILISDCPGDTFVFGATARTTARVRIVLADGSTVEADLHRRPRGSRVRAQYFMAALPGITAVTRVDALASDGRVTATQTYDAEAFERPCGVVIPD